MSYNQGMLRGFLIIFCGYFLIQCGHYQRPQYQSHSRGFQTQGRSPSEIVRQGPFRLYWPVDPVKITRGFIAARPHHGVDFDGEKNDPVYAAHEGYVIYSGSGFSGYGKMVIVRYDKKWASLYSHLNKISVKEGEYVRPRQVIGGMGRTGRATGVHLHFELMRNKLPIDPLPLLRRDQRLVSY